MTNQHHGFACQRPALTRHCRLQASRPALSLGCLRPQHAQRGQLLTRRRR